LTRNVLCLHGIDQTHCDMFSLHLTQVMGQTMSKKKLSVWNMYGSNGNRT